MLQSQATSITTVSRLISDATTASRHALESCCKIRALMREAWAENRLFDFNLWAAGVGASAKLTASLDHRLASQPEGRTVVMGLLSALLAALEECKELGTKQDLGQDLPCVSISESVEPSVSDTDQNSDLFPSWSDSSGSDSSGADSETKPAQDTLSFSMKSVEDLIDQLIQLGKIIRSSGATSRFRKADKAFDPAAHKDLQHFLTVLLLSNPRVIENRRPSAEHIDWKSPFLTLDFAAIDQLDLDHQKVVGHLISANLRRRSRFDYARKHAQKLAAHYDLQDYVQNISPGPHQDDLVKHSDALASPGMSEKKPKKQDPASNETPQMCHTALTDTTAASLVDPSFTITHPIPPSKSTMSRASISLSRLNYPNPPPISIYAKSFRCPCCFQTLSSWDHETKRWRYETIQWRLRNDRLKRIRKHLSQDILPYTCIFPNCSAEKCFYATRESWKQHMRQDHSGSTYWECLACSNFDTTEIFPDVEQFREHTRSVHGDAITEEQLLVLEGVCSKSSPASIESCPLCIYKDQDEIPTDPETLLNHIGDHIHDFSLLSLPWADFSEEEDAAIIAAATEKAMKWDITLPSDMETVDLPPLKPERPRTPNPEPLFAAAEYFAESSDGSSRVLFGSEQYLSLSEGSSSASASPAEDEDAICFSEPLGTNLALFIKMFRRYYRKFPETRKTRVALIRRVFDLSGGKKHKHSPNMSADSFGVKRQIVEEILFSSRQENEIKSYRDSFEPHGTRTADLIRHIDPCCDLYIANIADSGELYAKSGHIAKAIRWAQFRDVDVILLASVIPEGSGHEITSAIELAKNKDIVVIYSTVSVSPSTLELIRANVIPIAMCNQQGKIFLSGQQDGYHYGFFGGVRGEDWLNLESYLSVPAAIAAGIASLIVACCRISESCGTYDRRPIWRCDMVKQIFRTMSEGDWVNPENLVGNLPHVMRSRDFATLVNERFKVDGAQ